MVKTRILVDPTLRRLLLVFAIFFTQTRAQIQTLASGNFVQDVACGTTKTCFSDCQQATGCTYEAACARAGATAQCTITMKSDLSGDAWVAIGFSSDQKMAGTSVTGCKRISNGFSVFNAVTPATAPGYSVTEIAVDGSTLSPGYGTVDGVMRCVFTREMAAGVGGQRSDLNQAWYWLLARGGLSGSGTLNYHGATNRFISAQPFDLSTEPAIQPPVVPQTTTQPSLTGSLAKSSECGSSLGCFTKCDSDTSCTFTVTWSLDTVGDKATFTLRSDVGSSGWIALAFSADSKMGDDDVIGCLGLSDGTVRKFSAQNNGKSPDVYTDSSLELVESRMQDGTLSCTLRRPVASYSVSGKTRRDIGNKWTYFFARGSGSLQNSAVSINYHGRDNRFISSQSLSASETVDDAIGANPNPPAPQPTAPPVLTGSLAKSSECGSSLGCFTKCDSDTSCTFTVTWSLDNVGDKATFTLSSDVGSSSSWIGIGFSTDSNMGDDDVIGCLGLSDGTVRKFSAQNNGKSPDVYTDSSLELVDSRMQDGTLSCTLRRPVASYSVSGKTRRDIGNKWTYLFARGSGSLQATAVSLNYHGANDRFLSSQALSASDTVDDTAKDEEFPLIKLHGSLMIGAWVFLASIGIVAARYYKPVWKNDLCSQKVWFQIHRTCMVLVFCACVAGFVVIFVEVEEWIEIEQTPSYLQGHPIMGVIVTGLCVLNPLMALIRPHPDTKYRPIFNWAHWFVGTSAHILGVVTIFFGFELDKADAPTYLKYILAGYCGWQALVELTLEFMACCCAKKTRSEAYKMTDLSGAQETDSPVEESDGMDSVRKGLFVIHFFVVTAVSAVLIGLLVVGKEELDS